MLTKDELIEELRKIADAGGGEEESHMTADDLLLAFIDDEEVTDAFDSIRKWYV